MKEIIIRHLKSMEFVCGLKQFRDYDKEDALSLINAIYGLFNNYGWMTPERCDYILRAGLRGEYGDFYHVNEKTCTSWINQYFKFRQSEIVREIQYKNEEQETSEEEKEYWINVGKQNFIDKYKKAKETKYVAPLSEWGPYWYSKMMEKGILKPWNYPAEKIEADSRKEMRLAGRFINESTVAAKAKNKIWQLFILDCIRDEMKIDDLINS